MNAAARGIVLVALCLVTFFFRLGAPAITDSDEAFYAETGREMVESGDWTTPRYNYDFRFEKPILFYWLVAAAYSAAGVGETQARFFAALSGVGLVWMAYLIGCRWVGPWHGLLAGAMTATSFGIFWMARESLPDLPLAFFLTLGVWALIEATAPNAQHRRGWWLLGALGLGLALLTKGPVAVAVPAVAIVPIWLWERAAARRAGGRYTLGLRVSDLVLAAMVAIAIVVPWNALITRAHPDYLWNFLFGENLARFATTKYNDSRGPFFYVPIVLGGLTPWSPFLLLWAAPGWRWIRRQRPLTRVEARLLIWAAAPLILFTISFGKQPRYVLPCLVPLAVLLARSIRNRALRSSVTRNPLFTGAGILAGVLLAGVGAALARAAPVFRAADPDWSSIPPSVMMIAGALVILAALRASRRLPEVLAVAAALTLAAFTQAAIIRPRPEPVEIVSAIVRADKPDAVCACGAFGRNLTLYTRRKVVAGATPEEIRDVLARPDRVYAVVDSGMLPRIETMMRRQFRRLREVSYLNTGALRVGTFLAPDPARDVQHVILISNQ